MSIKRSDFDSINVSRYCERVRKYEDSLDVLFYINPLQSDRPVNLNGFDWFR